jgi:hypothetical protein
VPKAIYILIMVAIAYFVISFWTGYFKEIDNASHM